MIVMGVGAAACSTVDERRVAYRNATTLPSLEVPPDLLAIDQKDELNTATAPLGETISLSEYNRGRQGGPVATKTPVEAPTPAVGMALDSNVRVLRDGAQWWLNISGKPSQSWDKLKLFWEQAGLELQRENLELGVIETKWTENKAGVPMSSILRKAFESIYSNSTRDKFVMRIEPGEAADTTDIFLLHRGLQQVVKDDGTNWLPRASDRELEVEMLKRIAVFLGSSQERATVVAAEATQEQASAVAALDKSTDSQAALLVNLDFARTWRRLGNALTRLEFALEDFDRGRGLYYVSGTVADQSQKGWFSRLFGDDQPQAHAFKVRVQDEGTRSRVTVLTSSGEPDNSATASAFLARLEEEFNR